MDTSLRCHCSTKNRRSAYCSASLMSLKNIYAPAPLTTRGQPTHISLHPDGSKLAYACGRTVVIRSISNPLAADVYSEHTKNVTAVKISPRCRSCCACLARAFNILQRKLLRLWRRNRPCPHLGHHTGSTHSITTPNRNISAAHAHPQVRAARTVG